MPLRSAPSFRGARRLIALAAIGATIACRGGSRAPSAPQPSRGSQTSAKGTAGADTIRVVTTPPPDPALGRDSLSLRDTITVPTQDVTQTAVNIFGDSMGVVAGQASGDSGAAPATAEPTYDFDVHSYETRERVARTVARWSGPARDVVTTWIEHGGRYEPMIREKLHAAGLPEDLVYLAMVESGYDPHAYSRAAAVGMWQLMASTAKDIGLRVDWWVDQRRDPIRSTDAAIKFLHWLNDQFGSLFLAAAAYNGGPGRIARGLSRYADELEGTTGDERFFALAEKDYLPNDTKMYVPQLIAAALISKNPEHYGLHPKVEPPLTFDSLKVGPAVPLAALAKAAGVSIVVIRDLNPFILRGMTPPSDSFVVRVPVGLADRVRDSLPALPEAERRAVTRTVTKKGDTMGRLAARAGVSAHVLSWYNPGLKANKKGVVPVGRTVLFPSSGTVAAALDVPDPSIEKYGSSSRTRTVTYVVKHGDNLGSIASRYGTTVVALRRLNGLKRDIIIPGEVIIVRRGPAKRSRKK